MDKIKPEIINAANFSFEWTKSKDFSNCFFKDSENFNKKSEKERRPQRNVLKENEQTCSQEQRWKVHASYMRGVLVLPVDWLLENHLGYDWLKNHNYGIFEPVSSSRLVFLLAGFISLGPVPLRTHLGHTGDTVCSEGGRSD